MRGTIGKTLKGFLLFVVIVVIVVWVVIAFYFLNFVIWILLSGLSPIAIGVFFRGIRFSKFY